MEYYNNILCVEAGWLINEVGVLSNTNYDALVQRRQLNVVRRGCLNTPALVAYDSIPERFRKLIADKYGDPRKKITINVSITEE